MIITCLCIIAVVSIGAVFVAFHKSTELTVESSASLTKGEDFKVKLTSDGVGLANQEIKVTITDDNGEQTDIDLVTEDGGTAFFSTGDMDSGSYSVEMIFNGNSNYGSASAISDFTVEETAKEASSTSTDSGWAFDAPEGWHWERTQPGETWLIKDDGTDDKLYCGSELLMESKLVNGKKKTVYENPNLP